MNLGIWDCVGEYVSIHFVNGFQTISGVLNKYENEYYISNTKIDERKIRNVEILRTNKQEEIMKKDFRKMIKDLSFDGEE